MANKRQSALCAFLDVDLSKFDSAETSSDESFRIENHAEESDFESSEESDENSDEDESDEKSSDEEPDPSESKADDVNHENQASTSSTIQINITEKLLEPSPATAKLLATLVCCACLGDRSDDSNEIVECDGCKITVHEGCYGVSESVSVSSTVSSCSTEPWFCDACKANIKDPDCELCPSRGGIFKETDCGKWVHLVCALYVPGVAFGEVDQLSMVTLFEMQYNKWGAKMCSLCDDDRFARTGVCIGCDAGMCKTYFHVTCAQKAGFLSEAHHEEVDQADPFYAHCKEHSDKALIKHRKRNYNALLMQMKKRQTDLEQSKNEKPTPEQERIERKLKKHRIKYTSNKLTRVEPWVPTQKMPRLLTTSASACKKLMKKAELMGIDATALEFQEAQIASLTDIRKKWHIPPAFSTEFVGYYLDRSIRMGEMKTNLTKQMEANKSLLCQQQILRVKYDDSIKVNQDVIEHQKDLMSQIEQLHGAIIELCPSKQLPSVDSIGKPPLVTTPTPAAIKMIPSPSVPTLSSTPPPQLITSRIMTVPTAAALKMGVGFPLNSLRKDDTGRILSTQCISNDELMNECGICKKCTDQHLLAKCDTCHLYYHLGCLNPPLTRHPKRSKLYAWQCSECDKSDDSGTENVIIPKGPRRSRIRYSKDGPIIPDPLRDSFGSEKSMSMSRKSDESHHRRSSTQINGSEVENIKTEASFVNETVPTTSSSSPIETTTVDDDGNSMKKRGRKAKIIKKKIPMEIHEKDLNSFTTEQQEEQILTVGQVETVTSSLKDLPELENKIQLETTTMTKKGRQRPKNKEKPSITQISNKLQKKKKQQNDDETKPEVTTLIDMVEKVCPLEPFRTIADIPNSIPYPAPVVELPKEIITPNDIQVKQENVVNNIVMNGGTSTTMSSSSGHKHKKQKKNKRHRSHSPSSGDRQSSSKKHKRKHKHKNHDLNEAPTMTDNNQDEPEKPRIKIKFVQVGDDKTWSFANAGGNVKLERDSALDISLVNNHESNDVKSQLSTPIPMGNGHGKVTKKRKKPNESQGDKKARLLLNISPNKGISSPVIAPSHFTASASSTPIGETTAVSNTAIVNKSLPLPSQICDVCQTPGSNQDLVKCDECQKNYHFTCLIPPLKKTPKKRGYSWHCADCDPTDRENN
ncbi:CLUMA_CG007997, isoform A [Clunio marinus]|uniref:CLUMA_CG007997, isoform A n=1 Tax=Clunio marinus TaxID=568069 RepID=A0A1J1I2R5_9DIPT|nr:CLUMA_CG007997, isoform A [Clunio marinus]